VSPKTPPLNPLASRRGNAGPAPLLLNVTNNRVPIAIHSAPPPASPASFFDNIHDGMHDLESSGESGDDGEDESESEGGSDCGNDADVDTTAVHEPLRPRVTSNVQPPASPASLRSKPSFSFSRFGNRSTPNVARRDFSPTVARFKTNQKPAMSHKPISNVPPPRPSFFSSKKSPKRSPLDLVQTMELPPPPLPLSNDSRSSLTRSMPAPGTGQKGQNSQDESLRKLDGLMLQHMEAEKSRIKKIAQTLHESKS